MAVIQSNDAVIVSVCRTPIGKLRGVLSIYRPDDLLALVLKEAVTRTSLHADLIEDVFAGCTNQAGEDNRNIARMSSLLAGFPDVVPGVTVNRLCASGLETIIQASRSIRCQDNACVLAAGVESMSRAPWVMAKPDKAFVSGPPTVFDTALGWRFKNKRLEERFPLEQMGETAENVAKRYDISRAQQDDFALLSHQRAVQAQRSGYFSSEIIPVEKISEDEGPRADTSLLKLASLNPVFQANGSVTAGNSSSLNDGAAAVMITSREFAQQHGLPILATIRSSAAVGVDPRYMGIGPVAAIPKALAKANLSIQDIDVFEINEAFAAQALAVIKELKLDSQRVNLFGGAIALGHPLGCSGTRIVVTLLSVMQQQQARLGVASLCVGVGQGLALVVERE